jgi:valyl-tRNA synthetase
MSKSKGNILDPIDLIDGIGLEELIEKRTSNLLQPKMADTIREATRKEFPEGIKAHGTDALRFTYCALASTGRDIRFDTSRLLGYRNFCNKLWNAAHYVLANCTDYNLRDYKEGEGEYGLINKWIQSSLQETIQQAHQALENYRFDLLAKILYEFAWNEYCDWYLELSKPILTDPNESEALKRSTRYTLIIILEAVLRLIHPVMPFITEEIWQSIIPLIQPYGGSPPTREETIAETKDQITTSIMQQPYPEYNPSQIDPQAAAELLWIKAVIIGVRTIRAEMGIAPGCLIALLLHKGDQQDRERVIKHQIFLIKLGKLTNITWLETNETPPPAATHLVNNLELLIPLEGLIDKNAEILRINREINKLKKDLASANSRLDNPNYIKKAPEKVVAKEREKVAFMQNALAQLQEQALLVSGQKIE